MEIERNFHSFPSTFIFHISSDRRKFQLTFDVVRAIKKLLSELTRQSSPPCARLIGARPMWRDTQHQRTVNFADLFALPHEFFFFFLRYFFSFFIYSPDIFHRFSLRRIFSLSWRFFYAKSCFYSTRTGATAKKEPHRQVSDYQLEPRATRRFNILSSAAESKNILAFPLSELLGESLQGFSPASDVTMTSLSAGTCNKTKTSSLFAAADFTLVTLLADLCKHRADLWERTEIVRRFSTCARRWRMAGEFVENVKEMKHAWSGISTDFWGVFEKLPWILKIMENLKWFRDLLSFMCAFVKSSWFFILNCPDKFQWKANYFEAWTFEVLRKKMQSLFRYVFQENDKTKFQKKAFMHRISFD